MTTKTKKQTYVGIALDKSGSMTSIHQQAVGMFNEQLNAIRLNATRGGATRVAMVQFGALEPPVETLWHGADPREIQDLTLETYVPEGWTPLYDGVGRTIELLEELDDGGEDTAFLVVIVSDGEENASKTWSAERIATKVKELEATGRWTFVYLGANQDLKEARSKMGMGDHTSTYDWSEGYTTGDLRGLTFTMASSTTKYFALREQGTTATTNFFTGDDAANQNT